MIKIGDNEDIIEYGKGSIDEDGKAIKRNTTGDGNKSGSIETTIAIEVAATIDGAMDDDGDDTDEDATATDDIEGEEDCALRMGVAVPCSIESLVIKRAI